VNDPDMAAWGKGHDLLRITARKALSIFHRWLRERREKRQSKLIKAQANRRRRRKKRS